MRHFIVTSVMASALAVILLGSCGGGSGSGVPGPTVALAVSPASVAAYQTATLTWSSTNAASCSATGAEWTGPEPTSGTLPQSLSTPGTYTYTLTCTSTSGATASASTTLTIIPAQLAIITGALANGVIGTPFTQTIQATGGVAPFAWTVSQGGLPHDLSLVPSTTDTVTISGTPDTVAQGVAFTIEITDSAHSMASQPYTVAILLQADSLQLSPGSFNFGSQIVGSASSAQTETLTNSSTFDMVISNIALTPITATAAEFVQTGTTCGSSLAAGASCTISVTFTPGQTGPRAAAVTITDDTAGSPQSVNMGGVGLSAGPNATFSASSLSFGTQLVGTTSPARSLALTNYGAVALNIGSVTATDSFAETDGCGQSVASGASCGISISFTPGGSGDVSGTLSIADDAAGNPQTVSLSGTGSTMTPLLNGYCYSVCKRAVQVAACPAGQPSKTPGSSGNPCGPFGNPGVRVDLDRVCAIPPGGFQDRGYCETE